MWIEGRIFKAGKDSGLVAEAEPLDIITQGKNYNDAMFMLKDAIKLMVSYEKRDMVVEVRRGDGETVYIGSKDTKAFFGLLLRRQRQIGQITLQQAAANMGSAHLNAYAAYEQGKREPSLHLVAKLLSAANPKASKPVPIYFGAEPAKVVLRRPAKKAGTGRRLATV